MSTIVKPITHTVDLNEPVKKTYIDTLLATEDNLAHRFDITLLQGGQAVAMPSGADVTAYFIRYSDNATVPITGGAVNGNVASVTLTKACYNKPGQFALIIKVSGGGIVNTVFYGEGTVYTSSTDKVINDENVVPTLTDLLAQIAAMEAGTAAANTATNRANAAANRCEQMQIDASGMAGDSNKLGGQLPGYYAKQETVDQLLQQMANKMQMDLLWTNESPASNFVEQTIAVDFAQYGVIKIYWALSIGSNAFACAERPATAGRLLMQFINVPDTGITRSQRYATLAADKKSIHFGIDIEGNANGVGIYVVPMRIYGVKGVGA